MSPLRGSGVAMVAGFVLVVVASSVGPGRVYAESDPGARLGIIAENQARWILSNALFALGGLVTAAGLFILVLGLGRGVRSPVLALASIAYGLGSLAWAAYLFQRTTDPAGYLYVEPMPLFLAAFAVLTLIGLFLFGVGWLGLPQSRWPGFLTAGGAGLIALAWILFPARFYAGFPPQVLYLFTLMAGIALIRSGGG